MSLVSDIVSQRLRPPSELPSGVLMRWNHEPIALYQQNKQKAFYFIWPFLPFGVFAILYFSHLTLGMNKSFPFWILPLIAFVGGVVIIAVRFLPSDQWIELTEGGVNQRLRMPGGSGYFFSWAYKDVASCNLNPDSCKGVNFSVLKFFMKNDHEIKTIIVPEEINLDSVLKILRDKGVQVFEK
jgi:hypothetical protein